MGGCGPNDFVKIFLYCKFQECVVPDMRYGKERVNRAILYTMNYKSPASCPSTYYQYFFAEMSASRTAQNLNLK